MNNSNFIQKDFTNCIVKNQNQVLLGYKKRGFGEHKWNGFGGKLDAGETILQSAIREVQEECNITPKKIEFIGLIKYTLPNHKLIVISHLFLITEYEGEIIESEEMKPQWFDIDKIPFQDMWMENNIWYDDMLNERHFYGQYTMYGPNQMIESDSIHKLISKEELIQQQSVLSQNKLQ